MNPSNSASTAHPTSMKRPLQLAAIVETASSKSDTLPTMKYSLSTPSILVSTGGPPLTPHASHTCGLPRPCDCMQMSVRIAMCRVSVLSQLATKRLQLNGSEYSRTLVRTYTRSHAHAHTRTRIHVTLPMRSFVHGHKTTRKYTCICTHDDM